MLRGVVDQPFSDRPRVMPDHSAGLRIQRKGIVRGSDKHEAIERHRRDFQAIRIRRVEYPLCAQLPDILRIDLLEAAEPAARVIPIVRKPIRPHGQSAKSICSPLDRSGYGNATRLLPLRGRLPRKEAATKHCGEKRECLRQDEETPGIRPNDENINHIAKVSILQPASKFQPQSQCLNRINRSYVVLETPKLLHRFLDGLDLFY